MLKNFWYIRPNWIFRNMAKCDFIYPPTNRMHGYKWPKLPQLSQYQEPGTLIPDQQHGNSILEHRNRRFQTITNSQTITSVTGITDTCSTTRTLASWRSLTFPGDVSLCLQQDVCLSQKDHCCPGALSDQVSACRDT